MPRLLLLSVQEAEPVCFKNQSQKLLQHTFDLFPTLVYSSCKEAQTTPEQLFPDNLSLNHNVTVSTPGG